MMLTTLLGMGGSAGTGVGYGPNQGWFGMGHFMGFPGGGLFMILLIVLIVYLVVRLARPGGGQPRDQVRETPLDILKRRYAAGEIDQETFERMKRDLEEK